MENKFPPHPVSPPLSLSATLLATSFTPSPSFTSPYTMQSDYANHLIRLLVLSSGVVSTLAGQAGSLGSTNGIGTNAKFNYPTGIALDAAGTFAVVVRREGRGALREQMRLEGGGGMKDEGWGCQGLFGGLRMTLSDATVTSAIYGGCQGGSNAAVPRRF